MGCKNDAPSKDRKIDYEDAERLAESFSAPYTECSSKNNQGVVNVFELILI